MTTYYIKQNDTIVLSDTDKQRLINTLVFTPQYKDLEIQETENLIKDGVLYTEEEYEAEQAEKEKERINNLTMTALDFITGLQLFGLTLETINNYLEANLELKMQLTYCQNVYCYVVKQLCPLTVGDFTLTEKIAEALFLYKAGEITEDDLLSSTDESEE
ncbi:MAG: hypothetical protein LUG16_06990 [Candidatus Gastranaerophilales bacterium]|nr:hypothetical protein [Candidatus Gastranaerophilales bacterium]